MSVNPLSSPSLALRPASEPDRDCSLCLEKIALRPPEQTLFNRIIWSFYEKDAVAHEKENPNHSEHPIHTICLKKWIDSRREYLENEEIPCIICARKINFSSLFPFAQTFLSITALSTLSLAIAMVATRTLCPTLESLIAHFCEESLSLMLNVPKKYLSRHGQPFYLTPFDKNIIGILPLLIGLELAGRIGMRTAELLRLDIKTAAIAIMTPIFVPYLIAWWNVMTNTYDPPRYIYTTSYDPNYEPKIYNFPFNEFGVPPFLGLVSAIALSVFRHRFFRD